MMAGNMGIGADSKHCENVKSVDNTKIISDKKYAKLKNVLLISQFRCHANVLGYIRLHAKTFYKRTGVNTKQYKICNCGEITRANYR